MTKHVDGYSTNLLRSSLQFFEEEGRGSLADPLRWEEGNFPLRSEFDNWYDRWNGYVYVTKPHEDGECDQYRPSNTKPRLKEQTQDF